MYYDIKHLAELAAEIKDSGSIDLVAGLADMAFCKGAITLEQKQDIRSILVGGANEQCVG